MNKLIDEISKLHRYVTQHFSRQCNVNEALGAPGSKRLNAIFNLANDFNQWVSVDEEMPEDIGYFLVAIHNENKVGKIIEVAYLGKFGWFTQKNGTVTHWMNLPEDPH